MDFMRIAALVFLLLLSACQSTVDGAGAQSQDARDLRASSNNPRY
jgi:hypothetical protein